VTTRSNPRGWAVLRVLTIGLIAVAPLTFGLTSSARATTTNVVPNPGFEQGGCGGNTPDICGWQPDGGSPMFLDSPHSGSASLGLAWSTDFYTGMGPVGLSARTDPAFCGAIGPGVHPASFWYASADGWVSMAAAFYQAADCTGVATSVDSLSSPGVGGWQQVAGTVTAPPGTQSALFSLSVGTYCDYAAGCSVSADFDDLDVEDAVVPGPGIGSFSPTSAPVGASVDIKGANFTGATSVEFNGTDASFTVDSDSELYATVPGGATEGPISVTTPAGTGISHDSFAVAPSITSFSPTAGPIDTVVDIRGANFTGATIVRFNGIAAYYFRIDSDSEIHAAVPSGATSGPISVTTPEGIGTSSSAFTVDAPPIPSFSLNCTALTCSFDGSPSTDPDGTIQSYSWSFGDGTSGSGSTGSHTYAQPAGYVVTLTVIDDPGASGMTSKTVTLISLSARGYKPKGLENVDLSWSGPSGASFDIYRNGARIATVQGGSYTDSLGRKGQGTYAYKVCAAVSVCSNTATVTF
jgi:PKD domain/IPT/TIG domain